MEWSGLMEFRAAFRCQNFTLIGVDVVTRIVIIMKPLIRSLRSNDARRREMSRIRISIEGLTEIFEELLKESFEKHNPIDGERCYMITRCCHELGVAFSNLEGFIPVRDYPKDFALKENEIGAWRNLRVIATFNKGIPDLQRFDLVFVLDGKETKRCVKYVDVRAFAGC